jgi:16S rRNA (cytidine1402-2'-O)-methyltransferase
VPIVGSSSILLAMMASGLNGQNFAFNGYLHIKSPERKDAIKQLERKSKEINQSQLFIETPYRNNQFLNDLKQLLSSKTMLCVASNITMPDEFIKTKTIQQWKRIEVDLHKKPTIFIIHSYNIDTNRRFNQ